MVRTGERGTPVLPRLCGAGLASNPGTDPLCPQLGSREFTLRPVLDWVRIGAEPEKSAAGLWRPPGSASSGSGERSVAQSGAPTVVAVDRAEDRTLA